MLVYSEELLREFQIIDVQEPLDSRPPNPNILDLVSLSGSPPDVLPSHYALSSPSSRPSSPHPPSSLGSTPPVSRPASPDFTRYGRRASRTSMNLSSSRNSSNSSLSRSVPPYSPEPTSAVSRPEPSYHLGKPCSSPSSDFSSRQISSGFSPASRPASPGLTQVSAQSNSFGDNRSSDPDTSFILIRRRVTGRLEAEKAECDKKLQHVINNITASFGHNSRVGEHESQSELHDHERDRGREREHDLQIVDLKRLRKSFVHNAVDLRSALQTDDSSSDGGYETEEEYSRQCLEPAKMDDGSNIDQVILHYIGPCSQESWLHRLLPLLLPHRSASTPRHRKKLFPFFLATFPPLPTLRIPEAPVPHINLDHCVRFIPLLLPTVVPLKVSSIHRPRPPVVSRLGVLLKTLSTPL
jgi:hypothetical protein